MSRGGRLSLRELNRATLRRQWLLERQRPTPAEAVGALAGLQAQHANSPYIALWSRVRDLAIADLEAALAWLHRRTGPSPAKARPVAVERYLTAYGPASLGDIGKWLGQPRVTKVRAAVEALGGRVVSMRGPDDRELIDLNGLPPPNGDHDAPARFLARWDSVLIAYDLRDRIIAEAHRPAVIKKNGDFLPTFLVDGMVAGLWTIEAAKGDAVLTIAPFRKVPAPARRDLEAEAERLVRFVEPEATRHAVTWAEEA